MKMKGEFFIWQVCPIKFETSCKFNTRDYTTCVLGNNRKICVLPFYTATSATYLCNKILFWYDVNWADILC